MHVAEHRVDGLVGEHLQTFDARIVSPHFRERVARAVIRHNAARGGEEIAQSDTPLLLRLQTLPSKVEDRGLPKDYFFA